MKRVLKKLSLISLCLVLVGVTLSICGRIAGGTLSYSYIYDKKEHKFIVIDEQNDFTVKEKDLDTFTNINIDVDSMNVNILTGDKFFISYPDTATEPLAISVQDGELKVHAQSLPLISFFGRHDIKEITITVPKDITLDKISYKNNLGSCKCKDLSFNDLELQGDCGNINIENITGKNAEIQSDSGNITLSNSTMDFMELKCDMGGCDMDNVRLTTANLELDCGNLNMTGSSIDELTYNGNLGNLTADTLICKNADLHLDSGNCTMTASDIDIFNADLHLGNCELFLIGEKSDYIIHLNTDLGNIKMNGEKQNASYTYDGAKEKSKSIHINNDSGNIELELK